MPITEREMIPELMDAPDLAVEHHDSALVGLRRLNHLSRASTIMARHVARLAKRHDRTAITLLDVACGGGDVPVGIAKLLRRKGCEVVLSLTDRSPRALALAQTAAAEARFGAEIHLGHAPDALPEIACDIVTNSLFLHHLERPQVVATLAAMAARASLGLVVSDLRRSAAGLALAWATCRLVTRSRIVHHDGPVSVRAAWTIPEMRAMAAEAGLTGARIIACWPWRMLLTWERP